MTSRDKNKILEEFLLNLFKARDAGNNLKFSKLLHKLDDWGNARIGQRLPEPEQNHLELKTLNKLVPELNHP